MTESKRYCFESCTQEEAQAESIGGLKRYWVRSPLGSIDMYFERDHWPENVEFVREVDAKSIDEAATDIALANCAADVAEGKYDNWQTKPVPPLGRIRDLSK